VDRNVPYALAPLMADEYSEIDGFTRIYEYGNQVQSFFKYRPDNSPMVIFNESNIDLVDKHFFSMFSFPFIKGTAGNALKVQNSVVISEDIAEKYFGNDNPMGKILNLNNQRNLTVTGVIHIPDNSHLQPDFIIPLQQGLENDWTWRDPSYVLLSQKTNLLQFKDKIAGFMNKKMPYNSRMSFQLGLLPITKVHLGFGGKTYVTIFFLVAVFILLIACTNYTNLATARSANRTREVGLRKVAGARKGQLIKQFLTESVLTSLVSFLFSTFWYGFFCLF
jgi:ABC-type antimicrobial peptide transport system permease subunit